jgi:hypothetical protein
MQGTKALSNEEVHERVRTTQWLVEGSLGEGITAGELETLQVTGRGVTPSDLTAQTQPNVWLLGGSWLGPNWWCAASGALSKSVQGTPGR